MKRFLFAIVLAVLTGGLAGTSYADRSCMNNNSKACRDARAAFAEHHGGLYPQQYYNQWYQGRQGRWNQEHNNWRYEGMDGDDYWKGHNGWTWSHHKHDHDRD